jgi:hypothetical protein
MPMTLPFAFCWTKIGIEAGESLESIFRRKEEERLAGGGMFFWGIGNPVGQAIAELVKRNPQPEVIFTPIKSTARSVDVKPEGIVTWTGAKDLDGNRFEIPAHALITSRFDSGKPKSIHNALVCASDEPLTNVRDLGTLDIAELENLLSGRPVGTSQVTAVVRVSGCKNAMSRAYNVVIRAKLVAPFFLRLHNPVPFKPRESPKI